MEIELLGKRIVLPSSINDLSQSASRYLVRCLLAGLDAEELSICLYKYLVIDEQPLFFRLKAMFEYRFKPWYVETSVGKFLHEKLNIDIQVYRWNRTETIEQVIQVMSFLFDKEDKLYLQKVISFREGFNLYVGPGDYAEFISYGQFWSSEVAFLAYTDNPSEDNFNVFVKSLYKRKRSLGFGFGLTPEERELILMFYATIREGIFSEFPEVFPRSGKRKEALDLEEYQDNWLDVLDSIAVSPDRYLTINDLPARDVLRHINKKIKDNKPTKND